MKFWIEKVENPTPIQGRYMICCDKTNCNNTKKAIVGRLYQATLTEEELYTLEQRIGSALVALSNRSDKSAPSDPSATAEHCGAGSGKSYPLELLQIIYLTNKLLLEFHDLPVLEKLNKKIEKAIERNKK